MKYGTVAGGASRRVLAVLRGLIVLNGHAVIENNDV